MDMIIDYCTCVECKNEDAWFTCYKCGECGRVFNDYGYMVDDGGTTVDEGE